jgi:hypothetical protein
MLTTAPDALVEQLNIVNKHWNLCTLSFKSMNDVYFNIKFASLTSLISVPGVLINMTLV